tara:strand:- start:29645 stop:30538 length:894 start_codon:yes stop_codon:yes gene_type:complete
MTFDQKIFYNTASSAKLGWLPSWFGVQGFGRKLIKAIKEFQKEYGLKSDGLVGPVTFRRLFTQRTVDIEMLPGTQKSNYIICNEQKVEIEWDKVVSIDTSESLVLPKGNYRTYSRQRKPSMIATHWDVALSAASCYNILRKKGISTHFAIDNDGTIYQFVDTNHACWHAGIRVVNNKSIGIDLSNAYYTKYNKIYERRGFGPRPIVTDSVIHGRKLGDHLGFYGVQIQAYSALVDALCSHYGIPLQSPEDAAGNALYAVHKEASKGKFKGVVSHFHLTRRKIDTAGLDIQRVLNNLS